MKEQVIAYISAHPGCSKSAIEGEVRGKAEAIRSALKGLTRDLDVVVVPGPNRTHQHYIQGQQPIGTGQ